MPTRASADKLKFALTPIQMGRKRRGLDHKSLLGKDNNAVIVQTWIREGIECSGILCAVQEGAKDRGCSVHAFMQRQTRLPPCKCI